MKPSPVWRLLLLSTAALILAGLGTSCTPHCGENYGRGTPTPVVGAMGPQDRRGTPTPVVGSTFGSSGPTTRAYDNPPKPSRGTPTPIVQAELLAVATATRSTRAKVQPQNVTWHLEGAAPGQHDVHFQFYLLQLGKTEMKEDSTAFKTDRPVVTANGSCPFTFQILPLAPQPGRVYLLLATYKDSNDPRAEKGAGTYLIQVPK